MEVSDCIRFVSHTRHGAFVSKRGTSEEIGSPRPWCYEHCLVYGEDCLRDVLERHQKLKVLKTQYDV